MLLLSILLVYLGVVGLVAAYWMNQVERPQNVRRCSDAVGIPGFIVLIVGAVMMICSYGQYLNNHNGVGKWTAFYQETITRYEVVETDQEVLISTILGSEISIKEVVNAVDFLVKVDKYNRTIGSLRGFEDTPLVGDLIPDTSHLKFIVIQDGQIALPNYYRK